MMVNMPVEAINEYCINCPELEIDIYTKETGGGIVLDEKGKPQEQPRVIQNMLQCAHYNQCMWKVQNVLKKAKTASKTPAKKTKRT